LVTFQYTYIYFKARPSLYPSIYPSNCPHNALESHLRLSPARRSCHIRKCVRFRVGGGLKKHETFFCGFLNLDQSKIHNIALVKYSNVYMYMCLIFFFISSKSCKLLENTFYVWNFEIFNSKPKLLQIHINNYL